MRGQIDNTDYYENLGKKLLEIREKKGLTQKDLASKVGVTFQQWQKYEKGTNRIPAKSLVIFCEITGSSIVDITGSNVLEYEKNYKQSVTNYNNTVNNIYNYNGFFSKFLNMDLNVMRNKVVVASVIISFAIWVIFALLKAFPIINAQYNLVFLSIQIIAFLISFAVALFAVFGYSFLTYSISYIAYVGLYSLVVRFIESYFGKILLIIGFDRVVMYSTSLVLTFLTFYILKKCKVNLDTGLKVNKKEV